MIPLTTLTSVVAPLMRDNIDTDAIIPSREMKSTGRTGLADGLFASWRYVEGRTPAPDFVLNRPAFAHAQILASGVNFGCGSSREHAVWALAEWGIRAVVAQSFAPIFRNNCIRNGLLPVVLPKDAIADIAGREITIDLSAQTVADHRFEIDAEAKAMLIEGLDAIDLTLKHADAISAFHQRDRAARPWVYLNPPQAKPGEGDHAKHGGGVSSSLPKPNGTVVQARELRRTMSLPERLLWTELRKRPAGLKFRRQHPAGPFVLDFYCAAARLCIEVDSEAHERGNRQQRDERRDRFLADHGVATLRIPASAVLNRRDDVMRHLEDRALARIPLHQPLAGPPPHSANEEDS